MLPSFVDRPKIRCIQGLSQATLKLTDSRFPHRACAIRSRQYIPRSADRVFSHRHEKRRTPSSNSEFVKDLIFWCSHKILLGMEDSNVVSMDPPFAQSDSTSRFKRRFSRTQLARIKRQILTRGPDRQTSFNPAHGSIQINQPTPKRRHLKYRTSMKNPSEQRSSRKNQKNKNHREAQATAPLKSRSPPSRYTLLKHPKIVSN